MQKILSILVTLFIVGGLLYWVVSQPAEAGTTAGGLVTGVVGAGANVWEAGATFVNNITSGIG